MGDIPAVPSIVAISDHGLEILAPDACFNNRLEIRQSSPGNSPSIPDSHPPIERRWMIAGAAVACKTGKKP